MTDIMRGLPCSDLGSTLPTDAESWANQAHKEVSELWNRTPILLTDVAGINDITAVCASNIPLTAYQEGQAYWFVPVNDNTGAMTININGLGATSLVDRDGSALASGAVAAGRSYQIVRIGSAFRIIDSIISEATVPFPRGYFDGFITVTNAIDPNHDIDVGAGVCRNAQDTANMIMPIGMTKRSDAVWAQGTNQGGMLQSDNLAGVITVTTNTAVTGVGTSFLTDFAVGQVITTAGGQCRRITVISSDTAMTVTPAWSAGESSVTYKRGGKAPSTLYRILAIRKDSDGTVDIAFCPEGTPTDLPAGWSTYRTLWHFYVNSSSTNLPYLQTGNLNILPLTTDIASSTGGNGTTDNIVTSIAPPNAEIQVDVSGSISGSGFTNSGSAFFSLRGVSHNTAIVRTDSVSFPSSAGGSIPPSSDIGGFYFVPLNALRQYVITLSLSFTGTNPQTRSGTATTRIVGWRWDPAKFYS